MSITDWPLGLMPSKPDNSIKLWALVGYLTCSRFSYDENNIYKISVNEEHPDTLQLEWSVQPDLIQVNLIEKAWYGISRGDVEHFIIKKVREPFDPEEDDSLRKWHEGFG